MIRKARSVTLCLAPFCLLGPSASADLLELQPKLPQLFFDNQGVTVYDAATDTLTVSGTPAALRFAATDSPRFVDPTGDPPTKATSINIVVDSSGNLVGGVPGDDLIVVGEVDADGNGSIDFDGVLLTGEILAFGFEDLGKSQGPSTDIYDFRFELTGGSLAKLYGDRDIGVVVTSETSSFIGDFSVDFGGEAKGVLGRVEPQRACCFFNSCTDLLPQDCIIQGGELQDEGILCSDDPCIIPECLGDTNFDGVVNFIDLINIRDCWGETGVDCPEPGDDTDLNDDGVVSVIDLVILILNWGPCKGP